MLEELVTRGRHSSQKVLNALILVSCDAGEYQNHQQTAEQITNVLPVSMRKIDRVKQRFVENGLEAALEKQVANRESMNKADGDFEAHLIALSCSKPPPGHARWTLRLLADRRVEME
jgi:hypothetical protein